MMIKRKPSQEFSKLTKNSAPKEILAEIKHQVDGFQAISTGLSEIAQNFTWIITEASLPVRKPVILASRDDQKKDWEICTVLSRFGDHQIFLCKQQMGKGISYAAIDPSPASASGHIDILNIGESVQDVLRDYLKMEYEALEIMGTNLMAHFRSVAAESLSDDNLREVSEGFSHQIKSTLNTTKRTIESYVGMNHSTTIKP